MKTLEEILEVFKNDALAAVYDQFLSFKTMTDGSSDKAMLLRLIQSSKMSLADDLIIVHYPLKSPGQSQELKDYIKKLDAIELFKKYLDYYEDTCLGYLNKKFPTT